VKLLITDVVMLLTLIILWLQDSRLSLQTILSSPHLDELRSFARILESALGEVEELLDLWISCQNQAGSVHNFCRLLSFVSRMY